MKPGKTTKTNTSSSIAKVALYGLLVFLAFTIADLTIIYFRDRMIPDQAPPQKVTPYKAAPMLDRSQFTVITNRNLFSSTGSMPEAITAKKEERKDNAPVPSQLPITVLGTLVHSDPEKSIAALEIKSKNLKGSFIVGSDLEGLARLEKVERGIIFIRNSGNGLLEYVEMSKAPTKIAFDASKAETKGKEIVATGANAFSIKRSDLLKYTSDLASILMQARAVPNRDPSTGEINGFRVLDMQPGSIYEQLGFQRMDVIRGVNGEPVNSVQKAMEMYNTLKNGNQVKLQIERGGKLDTFTYDIK